MRSQAATAAVVATQRRHAWRHLWCDSRRGSMRAVACAGDLATVVAALEEAAVRGARSYGVEGARAAAAVATAVQATGMRIRCLERCR